jgi:hypothetical protein
MSANTEALETYGNLDVFERYPNDISKIIRDQFGDILLIDKSFFALDDDFKMFASLILIFLCDQTHEHNQSD